MTAEITLLVTWPVQDNAHGYRVRLLDGQGTQIDLQDVVATSATFSPLDELTAYQLELVAYNAAYESDPQLLTVTTPEGEEGASSLVVAWEGAASGDTAKLLDGDGVLVQDLGPVTSPVSLTGLAPGTPFQLELTRADASVELIEFYSAVELPGEIPNLTWDYTRTSLSFAWDAATNGAEYNLTLVRDGEVVEEQLTTELSAIFEGLQGGTYYQLQIHAINVNGGSGPTTSLVGKTSPVPLDIVGDQYAETVYLMKPVAYWRMSDEAGSMVVRDMMERFEGVVNGASPFGNHASLMPSGGGRSAYFDGTTWMDFGNHADLGPRNSMAVAFWFKPTDDSVQQNLVHKAYGGALGSSYETNNRVGFYHGTSGYDGGTYQKVTAEAPVNEVRHVVLERDNDLGYLTIYMNGYPVLRTKDSYQTAKRGSSAFKIGKGHVTDLFKGYIQDVALFDKALGDRTVAEMVTAAGGSPPLVPDFGYFSVGGLALGSKIGWNPLTPEQYRLPNPTALPRHGRTEVMGKVVTSQNIGFFDQLDGSGGHPVDPNGRPSDFTRQGVIQGTVTDDQGRPTSRRIQVLERRTGRLVRQGWSDPERGQYRFDDLDPQKEWTVIGYDLTGQYNALISDRIQAVPLRYDKHGSTTVPVVVWFTVNKYLLQMRWAPVRGEPDEIRLYMSKTNFDESNLPDPEVLTGDTREYLDTTGMVFDDWYVAVGFVAGTVETISEVYKYTSTTDKPTDWTDVLADGLFAYYPLIEDTQDHAGGNHADNHGADVTNDGYYFNGSSDHLRISPAVIDVTQDFSLSLWVHPTDDTNSCMYSSRTVMGEGMSLFRLDGELRFDLGSQWTPGVPIPTNEWTHIIVLKVGNTRYVYSNGELIGENTVGTITNYNPNLTSIGASHVNGSNYANYLRGRVKSYRFYNKGVVGVEAEALYMEHTA